jgi:hypothetical protein
MKNTTFLVFSLLSTSALCAADGQGPVLPSQAAKESFQGPSTVGMIGGTFFIGRVARDIKELHDTAERVGSCRRAAQENPRYYVQLACDAAIALYCFCGNRS